MTIAPATTPSTATPEAQPTDLAPSPRRTVDIVPGEAALREAEVDGTTTLVVTDTSQLRDATIASLDQAARNAGRVVLVNPGVRVLRTLAPDVGQRSFSANGSLVAACDTDDIRRGESISRAQSAAAED